MTKPDKTGQLTVEQENAPKSGPKGPVDPIPYYPRGVAK